ncbi:SGNH hydrolase domain-containing protein, partial [Kocuria rosea]|uniref:SGNH hydrolase domain-containing protein n=1 Tax=Kocuria rosea TaxID=1275 RepID=UPI002040B386|nr:hypothetical protein [Kocuria rosea]
PAAGLEDDLSGFGSIDMTEVICPEGHCPPAVGNVWVYRDTNHLTQDYARTAVPQFRTAWDEAMARTSS